MSSHSVRIKKDGCIFSDISPMTLKMAYALQMQRVIAFDRQYYSESDPRSYILSARWWYWHSKYSANPQECIRAAKSQYRIARDMQSAKRGGL